MIVLFFVSFNSNSNLCFSSEDFFIDEIFSPPLIIGQVIVALIVSSSFSSIVELKSLFWDLETDIEADLIVPVPDSGVPAALGYAQHSKKKLSFLKVMLN